MAKQGSAERRRWQIADVARQAAQAAGAPPPSGAHLDAVYWCWEQAGRPQVRDGRDLAAAMAAHQDELFAAVDRDLATIRDLGMDAWLRFAAFRHRLSVAELVEQFARDAARWADPATMLPDSWALAERLALSSWRDDGGAD